MSKYTDEIKIKVVMEYIKGNEGYKTLAKRYSIKECHIIIWVRLYKYHGIEGITNRNRKYSGEFKLEVLKYKEKHKLSTIEVSAKFMIPSPSTILVWERIYKCGGKDALFADKRKHPMSELKKSKDKIDGSKKLTNTATEKEMAERIKYLEMENEYLKKLRALVLEKEEKQDMK